MITNKHHVNYLKTCCKAAGITHIVISPGSRNAPVISAFTSDSYFKCYSHFDERCAAFIALGMAKASGKPVAVSCTSGTATLNFAPAVAEAHQQGIPLLVITADRPPELQNIGENQTINQVDIYKNFVKASYNLPADEDEDSLSDGQELIKKAIHKLQDEYPGPVHINIPLREPLYEFIDYTEPSINLPQPTTQLSLTTEEKATIRSTWEQSSKRMLLLGPIDPDPELTALIQQFQKETGILVLSEWASNWSNENAICNIDPFLEAMNEADKENYKPDLLISFGSVVTSKKLTKYFKEHPPKQHWHISARGDRWDRYGVLTMSIALHPFNFLVELSKITGEAERAYATAALEKNNRVNQRALQLIETQPLSDLWVHYKIAESLRLTKHQLFLGNSSVIRYWNLLPANMQSGAKVFASRGTSGIDGIVSTAAGIAATTKDDLYCITGDVAFFYDSNALMMPGLPKNLKVILINNGGGNIFRIIPGPVKVGKMEAFIETKHQLRAKNLAEMNGIFYDFCEQADELHSKLAQLIDLKNQAGILEIITPGKESAAILANYFEIIASDY